MDMTAWWGALPRLLVMVAVLFVPGAAGVHLLGVRGIRGWSLGPLVAASVAGTGAVVCAMAGIRWDAGALAVSLGVFVAACALSGLLRHGQDADRTTWRGSPRRSPTVPQADGTASGRRGTASEEDTHASGGVPASWGDRGGRALAIVLPLAWLTTVLPVVAVSSPTSPIQQYDPVFHMNALWLVLRDGDASSFGGLTRMFGMDTTPATVPAGWHALVAPFASATSIVPTVNVFSLVVPLVWLVGMAALTGALLPGRRGAPALVVALAPTVVAFPTYLLTKYPAWPNALAMALLPSLIALGVSVLSGWRGVPARELLSRSGGQVVLFVFLLVGICLVHPLAGLSLALLGLPAVVVVLARRWSRLAHLRRGWLVAREASAVVAVVVAGWLGLQTVPGLADKLSTMTGAYQTVPNTDWYNPLKALVLWSIVDGDASPVLTDLQMVVAVLMAVLTVAGLVRCLRSRAGQYLAASWFGAWLLTLTTLMRSGPLLPLAGLWYMSSPRAMAVQAVVQLPVVAQGARAIKDLVLPPRRPGASATARHRRTRDLLLPVSVVVALVGGAAMAPLRDDLTWRVYSLDSPFVSVMLDPATEALAERASELLPADAVVLGDPFNGSAYLQVLGDREVVFPQLYFRESNADEDYLRLHFSQVTTDPKVCTILQRHGIDHAWIDADPWHAGADQALVSPGLYGVDLTRGFEVLATAGSVSLVRITACG